MVSLWGQNRSHDQDDDDSPTLRHGEDNGVRGNSAREPGEADERTRLLPRRRAPRQDGFLDPDDPAVSPYNLWTVRFLHYITVIFLAINFIWWIVLLVSLFVTPPGVYFRGSGFLPFALATLTSGNLLLSLLFFANPSSVMRISAGVIAAILLVDVVIIASVPHIRLEEGWVGIATAIWAALMAIWCVVTDRVVAWGKREEEERLTGRPESRHTLKEWLGILIATVVLIIYIIIVVFITGTLILRASDATLDMDGKRYYVDGGRYQVHLACIGEPKGENATVTPTILLEAGEEPLEYGFEHWAYAAYQNGTISRYCYWDRPGYAWSDNAPSPHSAGMSADALSEALAVAGEEGPWIVVGAGYGSIVSRIFSARHLGEVKGMLLVDPLHEDLLRRIASPFRGFKLWGWGILSPLGIRRIMGAIFEGERREDRVYGRAAGLSDKLIKARLQECSAAETMTKNEVITARTIQAADMPLAIVSSGVEVRRDREWEKKQEDLTKLSKKLLSWDVVAGAPHRVWESYEGRMTLESRLAALVKKAKKTA